MLAMIALADIHSPRLANGEIETKEVARPQNGAFTAIVAQPEHHHYSSVRANLVLREDSLMTPHPCVITIGNTPSVRADTPWKWLKQGGSDNELTVIRRHLQQEYAFGSKRSHRGRHMSFRQPWTTAAGGRPARGIQLLPPRLLTDGNRQDRLRAIASWPPGARADIVADAFSRTGSKPAASHQPASIASKSSHTEVAPPLSEANTGPGQ